MPKCEYIPSDGWSKCGDPSFHTCVNCGVSYCENHDLFYECVVCEVRRRCIDCDEICKICLDHFVDCCECGDYHKPANRCYNCSDNICEECTLGCEDCSSLICNWCSRRCKECWAISCCAKKINDEYYCEGCYSSHTKNKGKGSDS